MIVIFLISRALEYSAVDQNYQVNKGQSFAVGWVFFQVRREVLIKL